MKYGVRKPSIKKSVKARTTGKVTRSVKKATNPLYGKKGMGVVNNPKKAAYNAVYSRTTTSVFGKSHGSAAHSPAAAPAAGSSVYLDYTPVKRKRGGMVRILFGIFFAASGLYNISANSPAYGIFALIVGICLFVWGFKVRKKSAQ